MPQSLIEPAVAHFGALLKRYRRRAGISQEALAEAARLSVDTVSALERGARRKPYRDTIALLVRALALSASDRALLESAANRPATARASATPAVARPPSVAANNLPLQLTSFVGRTSEVDAIAALMHANRLVTLIGPGGVGKTRVAVQVAAAAATAIADEVWLVELAALTDPELVPSAIAGALGGRLPADRDPEAGLCALVAARRMLLVLDNCEHLIAAAGAIAKSLLRACPDVTVLATSRQALGIAGEATYAISALSMPDDETAAVLSLTAAPVFDALTLFVDRARSIESSFALTEQNVAIVAAICRRLDGIPLAIELAASRIKTMSPRDLHDRLGERFRLLAGGRDALPRQQALRALIGWSYDLLGETERRIFARVGVFTGGFTLEAATAICADANADELDVLDVLSSLIDKSLILAAVNGDAMRYRVLESTRMYALDVLGTSGEREEVEVRHMEFFCDLTACAEATFETRGSDALFVELAPDLENVRSALRYLAKAGNSRMHGMLAVSAARLFGRAGFAAEGIGWLAASLGTVEPADLRLQSRIWSRIAYLAGNSGRTGWVDAAERAVDLARLAGDRELVAWALTQNATAAMDQRRLAAAEVALAEAAELFGPAPQPHQRARILAVRHHIARLNGDVRAAISIGEELLALYRGLANESGELRTMINQAELQHAAGNTPAAIVLARTAVGLAVLADRETRGLVQINLGAYLAAVGDAEAAHHVAAEGIALLVGSASASIAVAIGHLALAHALGGDTKRAARLLGYWDAASQGRGLTRDFTELSTYERLSTIVAERLTADERNRLVLAGAALTPADAVAEALRVDE